ncbi:hypothetical protein HHL22_16065 [Hymenobacter sp. RP-2-7]|uniref:DUF1049 domain-containing protein n=1 Tax=Hymenobacter polaris TaxID=2682546 RepID=A0A7Y0AG41_9BACT|nr:hypothetical protein [Hymenobacter polaris]NML66724.1 hypothetical protein [Hymenobacter polaris]
MLALKRFVTIVVMVYLLLAVLFFLFPAVRTSVAELGSGYSPTENERNFYQLLALIGAVIMAVQLVVENIDSSVLRRTLSKQDSKVNELKAKLYDHQTTAKTPPPAVGYPTAAEAAAQRPRTSPDAPAPGSLPPVN